MSANDWANLRAWLFAVFPEAEADELFAEHVAEAQAEGLPLPEGYPST